eukprot:TRINITY_DN65534_c0_g1_i1.p2 TRINITY_DN65534_c0_g1~~TRINITY_DN65534_c0_g1_i1.p2  ORF type:complete len:166 (-),score=25.47 TRINITY_DN65534_c0_g1_i1:61-558(-)
MGGRCSQATKGGCLSCSDEHETAEDIAAWRRGSAIVYLNVYDVTRLNLVSATNSLLRQLDMGVFHCAVEVYENEWAYGPDGVYMSVPQNDAGHTFRESIEMGKTTLSYKQVASRLRNLIVTWPGDEYHLLRHNCCHFAERLCRVLGMGALPPWVFSFMQHTKVQL